MDPNAWIGLYCFIGMFVLVMIGIPIFIALLVTAFAGFWLIGGTTILLQQFQFMPYAETANYTLAVVPLFILMGILAAEAGIAEDAFDTLTKWLSGLRGGHLMATIGAAALFGACSGSAMASSAVFTKVSLPELEKYKYDKRTSMGCIAAAGGLAAIIPPSVGIVVFCMLVEKDINIGEALIAGIIPGIMITLMLIAAVWIKGRFNPEAIPKISVQVSWGEKFLALAQLLPIIGLFGLVIGGIYLAWFPPTVGGAIGAFGVLIYVFILYALQRRGITKPRIKMRKIGSAFWETILIGSSIFALVIGGLLFARMIAMSRLPDALMGAIVEAELPALAVMGIVILFYLFCGAVLEFFGILIITLPVVFPLLLGLGWDPLVLIIILVLMGNIAGLTPPIGVACFVVASVAKVDPTEVFRGILPYFLVLLIAVWLLIFFPEIATWLPTR